MIKKIIISIIIVFLLAAVIYQVFLKKEKSAFALVEVKRGQIIQAVSETGQVEKGEKINLGFQNAGKIEKIYVEVGENVKKGDILAKLETNNLKIQLQDAKAALSLVQAQLNKLLAGASQEEIKVAQTKVENSQVSLDTAKQNLDDAYEDAVNNLNDSYLKAYNAQNSVAVIQRTYFITSDQEGVKVKENKEAIETAVSAVKSYLNEVQNNPTEENIDLNLNRIKNELSGIFNFLAAIREACEAPSYRNAVSSTDKSSLDTQRANINTAVTNVVNSQQLISADKLSIESAELDLQTTKDNLALVTAPARQEDVDLYRAKVNQANAQVDLLENQNQESILKSPVDGQIAEINKRAGETIQPVLQDSVITLLPASPYDIKADIYEEDVVKMKIDNEVEISLVAFSDQTFKGKVISIYPAENLIDGVVYYKIIVAIDQPPEGIKSGMTADLQIKTASKENVLIVPKYAVQKKDGKKIVEVLENGKIQEKEIQTGLEGTNDMVEVISGLEEGEKVVVE